MKSVDEAEALSSRSSSGIALVPERYSYARAWSDSRHQKLVKCNEKGFTHRGPQCWQVLRTKAKVSDSII